LFGVGGMFGLAGRDLVTRSITVPISGAHLSLHAFLVLIPAGLFLVWINGDTLVIPTARDGATLIGCIAIALLAYLCIVAATRAGDAAFISSFRYTRMIFALILGMVVLNERPDQMTLIGVAIVIGAGLFTLLREARLRRTSQASLDPL
jgi:drug/metabolite transporter (DMT)-like permease